MMSIPLTSEEDEVLDLLEGRRPQAPEGFHRLVALLMERYGLARVTPRNKGCCSADSRGDRRTCRWAQGRPSP
jgi:hypothetical protein